MALTQEDQAWILQQIGQQQANRTVRIPELPPFTSFGDITLNDRFPMWLSEPNKTVWASLQILRTIILTGGVGTIDPAVSGNSVFVTVGEAEDNQRTYNVPELAGKKFTLRRSRYGGMPPEQYTILQAGGFTINEPFPPMSYGEVFELELSEPASPLITQAGSLVNGVLPISSSGVISSNNINKIIQIRAQSSPLTAILPSTAIVAKNTIVFIEATIQNTVKSKIQPGAGQFIYSRNKSNPYLYIGPGETMILYRSDDGWYQLPSDGNWGKVGKINMSYDVGLNELALDGREVSRTAEPRLWEWVSSLSANGSLVSESDWQNGIGNGYDRIQSLRGCFSTGDGVQTFRLPNYQGMFFRGLENFNVFGAVMHERVNVPGGFQMDQFRKHIHRGEMGEGASGKSIPDNVSNGHLNAAQRFYETLEAGGDETRGKNIGGVFTINT